MFFRHNDNEQLTANRRILFTSDCGGFLLLLIVYLTFFLKTATYFLCNDFTLYFHNGFQYLYVFSQFGYDDTKVSGLGTRQKQSQRRGLHDRI